MMYYIVCYHNILIVKNKKFDIDHITPLSSGGTNNEDNLQILCKPCHIDKI